MRYLAAVAALLLCGCTGLPEILRIEDPKGATLATVDTKKGTVKLTEHAMRLFVPVPVGRRR